MMKSTTVPDCLNRIAEIAAELKEAERLRDRLLELPDGYQYDAELTFLDEKILQLQQQKDMQNEEAKSILDLLKVCTPAAFVAANLHFLGGLTWNEIADKLGFEAEETVKSRVYRALKSLSDKGLI